MSGRGGRSNPGRRLLIGEIGGHRGALARLAGWTAVEALPPLLAGQLVARALDCGFVAGHPWTGVAHLALLGVLYAVAAQATRRCFPPVAGIVESLRDVLLRRVVAAALHRATVEGRSDPAAVARITGQVETVRDVTAGVLLVLRRITVTVCAAVVGLSVLHPTVLLLVVPPLALSITVFGLLMLVLARRQRDVLLAEERVASATGPVVEGIRDVVACGAERHVRETVGADVDAHRAAVLRGARAAALRIPVVSVGAYLPVVLILVAAPGLLARGVGVGVLLGAVVYVTGSLEPALRALVQVVGNSGLRLDVALRRLAETTDVPGTTGPPGQQPRGHDIEFDGVGFAYGPDSEPVIRDLTLSAPAGDHLAVVGPSGIGKSTLANLLAGVERPRSGAVRIGGVDVADLDRPATVVLIPQEAYVFTGSLWENLTYLRQDAAPELVDAAMALFGLDPLAQRLGGPHGDLSPAALSMGERQRVALARAYLGPAPVVVLDEATCHLDPAAEAAAEQAFAARPGTLIVVAHRITSARRARHVLLMGETGVRHGDHESLLAASPLYRDLVGLWEPVRHPTTPGTPR